MEGILFDNRLLNLHHYKVFLISEHFSVTSPKDRSIFYSGFDPDILRNPTLPPLKNWQLANLLSGAAGFTRFEHTPGGRVLQSDYDSNRDKFNESAWKIIWSLGSAKFAYNVRGNVTAITNGAKLEGVFLETELPILMENKRVTSINCFPKQLLKEFAPHLRDKQSKEKLLNIITNPSFIRAARTIASQSQGFTDKRYHELRDYIAGNRPLGRDYDFGRI